MLFRQLAPLLLCTLLSDFRAFAAPSGRVAGEIASLIQSSTAVQRGNLGFEFVDTQSGEVIAHLSSAKFFAPASNTKLYTTALALVRLGPDYRFQTELRTTAPWRPGQQTVLDLELVGGGDPNLSGRVLPYNVHSVDADPLTVVNELAAKLAVAGIHRIEGDVTGVSTRYSGDSYPDGWTVDDTIYGYGSPVSALTLNDNAVSVHVTPTENGDLADVEVLPATDHLVVLNQVLTNSSPKTDIHLARRPDGSELVLWGTIGRSAGMWSQDVGIDDPALFAARALIDALREQNISVGGVARSRYLPSSGVAINASGPAASSFTILAAHDSVPLKDEIQVINKVSQNLHAEMLLREVGYYCRGIGSLEAGAAERDLFLQQIGIKQDGTGVALADGSGLARQNLTTPQSTVTLLRFMWQRPDRDVWLQSFPIGGVDGSLEHRFVKVAGGEHVHAKTGSYAHVNTLSGYIETNRHRWIAFSVMVNATAAPDSEVRSVIDHLCALFLDE